MSDITSSVDTVKICKSLGDVMDEHPFGKTKEYEEGSATRLKRIVCQVPGCKLPSGSRTRTTQRCYNRACLANKVAYCEKHQKNHHQEIWNEVKKSLNLDEHSNED